MEIKAIHDFDQTDVIQQYTILQNAKELLAYLNDTQQDFPYSAYYDGSERLRTAMSFIDDKLIHNG